MKIPFLKILLLALVYYIAARISVLFMVVPEKVLPLFPPVGIALGALILYGTRLWLGVFIGAFFFALYMSANSVTVEWFSPGVMIPSFFIAAGATLQALCGNWLLRRTKVYPGKLESFRDISIFVLLACPLSCMISATVAVITISYILDSPLTAFGFTWVSWWIGDSIGAIVFASAMLLLLSAPVLKMRKVIVGTTAISLSALTILLFQLNLFESLWGTLFVGIGGNMLLMSLVLFVTRPSS
jgi:integral membrane sensor domain MASE1